MEVFSLFFISGVADEGVAFSSVGATFCYEVHKLLPDLVLKSDKDHFKNLIRLFLLWNARMESRKLLEDKYKIESKLNSIDEKTIRPLGTE
jgi:hypothetical protein